jgi:6-phosphogluconolactonase
MDEQVFYYDDIAVLSRKAAEFVAGYIKETLKRQNCFSFVLAGGSSPSGLYRLLGKGNDSGGYREAIPWEKVHLFWGDERYVPEDNPDSNYKMAHDIFITKITVPENNVHRIRTGFKKKEKAAKEYEKEIFKTFRIHNRSRMPSFNLILLGMGTDGHIASLFPGYPELKVTDRLVVCTEVSPTTPNVERITMTLPLINQGKTIVFMIMGKKKLKILDEIFNNRIKAREKYPAALVNPGKGRLVWFILK